CRDQTLQPGRIHRCTDLHADRVGDAAEIFDVRTVQLRSAHSDPRHMRGQVVPTVLSCNEARLRLLIEQVQSFVARVEVNKRRFGNTSAADAFEKIERITNRVHDALVGILQLRMFYESQIPIFRVMQIRKTSINERTDKIQSERRALVPTQKE